jgi:beta-glucosidase
MNSAILVRIVASSALSLALLGCAATNSLGGAAVEPLAQPGLSARIKPIVEIAGLRFKDLNASSAIEPYEDWRLSPEDRASDLVTRMSLPEKAGMMLIATNNPACDGSITQDGRRLLEQNMTRFILRSTVTEQPADCSVQLTGFALRRGYSQSPAQMGGFTNAVQEAREASRLGIPALFKDNARNHVEVNPTFGITQGAGFFTEFPKEAGLAAAALGAGAPLTATGQPPAALRPDMQVFRDFTRVMGQEWRAIGLRGMYGYMLDLATEPRWSRFHETFSEDADLTGQVARELIEGLQGPKMANGLALSPQTAVSLTMKHFPGGGPQQLGLDPHYTFGKNQFYTDPSGRYGFDYHLAPFAAAIDAGVGGIMPYYGVPVEASHRGSQVESVGMAFSRSILTDLLRLEMGFSGYINSDSGIIEQRAWGLESYRVNPDSGRPFTVADRTARAIAAGTDILSEFRSADTILQLVSEGKLNETQDIDPAVRRLLVEQFALGLFEDPYVDASAATGLIGTPEHRQLGLSAQRRSVVLLQPVLPLPQGSSVYVMGLAPSVFARPGFTPIDGNYSAARGEQRRAVPAGTDYAILNVLVGNGPAGRYRSNDPAMGGRPVPVEMELIDPATGQPQTTWGAQDPCVYEGRAGVECIDNSLIFGGAFPWEAGNISFSKMAESESWVMYPSLQDIRSVMREIGDSRRVIISVYFRNPYVLDVESGVRQAGALIASFGVSDAVQADIITGAAFPGGRLPFALPASLAAVRSQHPDAPGYAETEDGALFPYGFGIGYNAADQN